MATQPINFYNGPYTGSFDTSYVNGRTAGIQSNRRDLQVIPGSAFTKTFTVKNNQSGAVIDLTNATFVTEIKHNPESTTAIPFTVTKPNATLGKFVCALDSTQTTSLSERINWQYQIKMTLNSVEYIIFSGTLKTAASV